MNLFNQLTSYLDAHFNGIKLKQPLFFSGIPGLRFDLHDEKTDTSNDAYFDEVVKRMGEIHAVTISPGDDILILYQTYTFKRRKIRKYNYLFKQFEASTANIQFKRNKTIIYEDGPYCKADKSCQVIISDKAANINFNHIYLSIANMDFNRRPFIKGELYVVNLTKQTVTLMYDDRGCDLISPNIGLLKDYYTKLTNLILEVNRPGIIQRLQLES
jgi:hypothetical protein